MVFPDVPFCSESVFVFEQSDEALMEQFVERLRSTLSSARISISAVNRVMDKILVTISFQHIDAYESAHEIFEQLSQNR